MAQLKTRGKREMTVLAKPKENSYIIKFSAVNKIANEKTSQSDMNKIVKNAKVFNAKISNK